MRGQGRPTQQYADVPGTPVGSYEINPEHVSMTVWGVVFDNCGVSTLVIGESATVAGSTAHTRGWWWKCCAILRAQGVLKSHPSRFFPSGRLGNGTVNSIKF